MGWLTLTTKVGGEGHEGGMGNGDGEGWVKLLDEFRGVGCGLCG